MNHVSDNSICSVYVTFLSFKFSLIVCFSCFRWHECFVGCQACAHVSVWTLGNFFVQIVLIHFRHVCSKWSTTTVQFGWLEHLFCNHMIFLNLDCPLLQKSPVCCTKPFQLLKSKVQWLLLCLLIAKNKCLMSSLQPKVNRVLLWSV